MNDFDEKPFSTATLSERWDCSEQHIRDLVNTGKLAAFRVGRMMRIQAKVVREFECQTSKPSSTVENGTPFGMRTAELSAARSAPMIVMRPSGR